MKRSGNQAQAHELGKDPAQTAAQSTEELSDTNQPWESTAVEGSDDAADHAERPAHTHEEYGRPDHVPPKAARQS